jgi:hypothetical protein
MLGFKVSLATYRATYGLQTGVLDNRGVPLFAIKRWFSVTFKIWSKILTRSRTCGMNLVVSEVARAELEAARGCWAARATCSVPVRRLGTALGRRRNACNNLFPTQVPMRSPPYHVRASPRLPPLRKVFLRIKF